MIDFGWVYFVGAPSVNRIKIGYTGRHPSKRFSNLVNISPVDLETMGLIPGTRAIEGLIHNFLVDSYWKNEWFNGTPLLLDFICENALPWSNADKASYPLLISSDEFVSTIIKTQDRIVDWFDARKVVYTWDVKGRGKRNQMAIRNVPPPPPETP